jgi:hypothetical protein
MHTRSKAAGNPLLLTALGVVAIGGVLAARRLLRSDARSGAQPRSGIMTRMFERLSADSPPKLIVTILPRLREQNDQIVRLLPEQGALLRGGQAELVSQ